MKEVTMENIKELEYKVFEKFSRQKAVISAGKADDFNSMTIGWGMLGNVWRVNPGITVYVSPSRYTWQFMEKNDYFTVCFFPKEYEEDVMTLGRISGRDGDKIVHTKLTVKPLEHGVSFNEAELTLVCKKMYAKQFDAELVPDSAKEMYKRFEPHYEYIGQIVDVFGTIE